MGPRLPLGFCWHKAGGCVVWTLLGTAPVGSQPRPKAHYEGGDWSLLGGRKGESCDHIGGQEGKDLWPHCGAGRERPVLRVQGRLGEPSCYSDNDSRAARPWVWHGAAAAVSE